MKVSELIAKLQQVDPDLEITGGFVTESPFAYPVEACVLGRAEDDGRAFAVLDLSMWGNEVEPASLVAPVAPTEVSLEVKSATFSDWGGFDFEVDLRFGGHVLNMRMCYSDEPEDGWVVRLDGSLAAEHEGYLGPDATPLDALPRFLLGERFNDDLTKEIERKLDGWWQSTEGERGQVE